MNKKIKITELDGYVIDIPVDSIRRYRGTEYGTLIEMSSGGDFKVLEDFDQIDKLVDEAQNGIDLGNITVGEFCKTHKASDNENT